MFGLLFVIAGIQASQAPDSIYGQIRDRGLGPVPGVHVEIAGTGITAYSDDDGRYVFREVTSGVTPLRFSRLGYDSLSLDVILPAGQSLRVDAELTSHPLPLPYVVVTGWSDGRASPGGRDTAHSVRSGEVGLEVFGAGTARQAFSSSPNPWNQLLTSSGVATRAELPSTVHVHAGGADQNLVLLDGLPLYGVTHIGGVTSPLNPDLVESIELHEDAPPARYGGRLSSVIDVRPRDDQTKRVAMDGGWDAATVRQTILLPLPHGLGSLLVAGRHSYRPVVAQDGLESENAGFGDLAARANLRFGSEIVSLYHLSTADHLRFPAAARVGAESQPVASGANDDEGVSLANNSFVWSSEMDGVVWRHRATSGTELTTRTWHSTTKNDIGWFEPGGLLTASGAFEETGLASQITWRRPAATRDAGFDLAVRHAQFQVFPVTGLSSDPKEAAGYLDQDWHPSRRLSIQTGIRAVVGSGSFFALEPRFSGNVRVADQIAIATGYARTHQLIQSLRNEESALDVLFGPEILAGGGRDGMPVARSDELSASLTLGRPASTFATVNGFLRRAAGLALIAPTTSGPFGTRPVVGRESARGLTLLLGHHTQPVDIGISYRLGSARLTADSVSYAPGFQRAQEWTLGVQTHFAHGLTLQLLTVAGTGTASSVIADSLAWQLSTGWIAPAEISGTPEQTVGPINGQRLPGYFRMDLGARKSWPVSFRGWSGRLDAAIMLDNVLNRQNAFAYRRALVGGLGLTPLSLPLRTLRFEVDWHL